MAIVAVLIFLTVAFLYLRRKYLSGPLGEFALQSQREHVIRAGEVLQQAGYRIVDERIAHEVATYLGSRRTVAYLVVDFLVEKDGVRHPVKVRSVRDPEPPGGAWLRSHLLAIWAMYEVPIVYVHPETETIELVDFTIDFPGRYYRRRWSMRILWLMIGIIVGWLLSLR